MGPCGRIRNIAVTYLEHLGMTADDYRGSCLYLTYEIRRWLGDNSVKILLVTPSIESDTKIVCGKNGWLYHVVPVIGGLVYDAWNPYLMLPPEQYAEKAFPDFEVDVSFPVDGDIDKLP